MIGFPGVFLGGVEVQGATNNLCHILKYRCWNHKARYLNISRFRRANCKHPHHTNGQLIANNHLHPLNPETWQILSQYHFLPLSR